MLQLESVDRKVMETLELAYEPLTIPHKKADMAKWEVQENPLFCLNGGETRGAQFSYSKTRNPNIL